MTSNNRKYAASALSLIKKLQGIISKIDKGAKPNKFEDNIANSLVKLGNAVKNLNGIDKSMVNRVYKDLRCVFAHRDGTEKYNPQKDYERWKQKFTDVLPHIESELKKIAGQFSQNLKKRNFEKNGGKKFGTEEEKKRIVDALEDSFDSSVLPEDKTEFPNNDNAVKDIVSNFDLYLKHYVSNHEGLSENVQTDILEWADDVQNDVEFESIKHFTTEKLFLDRICKLNPDDLFSELENIEEQYNNIDSVEETFDMLKYLKSYNSDLKKIRKEKDDKDDKENKSILYKQSYFQALIQSLTENFNARKAAFEQKLIDEKRKEFLKQLYEKIENFKQLEQMLQPIIDDLGHGYLWDMSNTPFRNLGFDILQKYSSLLKNDKALQEFAELLGSQSVTSQEVEKQIIEETVIKSEYHPKPAQSGNIVGFEYSNEISRVLPSETALLNDHDLENLFYLKFSEKQLLSYRYSQNVAFTYSETQQKEVEISKSKDLTGPIIICVDTSGSMQGTPEQTAKIATFAIAKAAIKQHRKCFLISFSTGIETLDMSDFKKLNALETLVGFLNKSFNGGTDATPALSECLQQLKTENYKNADVLMISDFVMRSLPANIASSIEIEKKNGTSFYSLIIGNSANNKAIECFNENIRYDPYSEYSRQEFYKKIKNIAIRKHKSSEQ